MRVVGLGKVETDVKRICKNAKVMPGLAIQGSYVSSAKSKVEQWIKLAE